MPTFVAFLRGINVGGHIVVKEKLQKAFSSLGFQNISTYGQSGNIVFETDGANTEDIKNKIEGKLNKMLGYDVVVFVRTIPQLKKIIDLKPFRSKDKEGASFLVSMLTSAPLQFPLKLPLTIPKSTAQIISAKDTEVFSVTHGSGEGGMPNPFLESKLKMKATTRNMNIIMKIVDKHGKNA
jgi:uncharacterized protein (DUF1697 family)